MAAKTWETDHRFAAIRASICKLDEAHRDAPFGFPGSFCLPVGDRPLVAWTPGHFALVALVLGFALLGVGALVVSRTDDPALVALAVGCSLSGIVVFFLPQCLHKQILRRLLGDRARELIRNSSSGDILSAELTDTDRSKFKLSITGDDHVLIDFDQRRRRLLIEGLGARYQFCAADVTAVLPYQVANIQGVEIAGMIDPQTCLRVAIARPSMLLTLIQHVPIFYFLRRKIPNKLLAKSMLALQGSRNEPR